MMIRLVEFDPDQNFIGDMILVDQDSITAAYRRVKNIRMYDYKDNGEKDYDTGRQEDIEYTEILLRTGHCFQVFDNLNSIYEMVNAK